MPIHAERRVLPYRPEQLFALVADVARYPEFLPWCLAARVRSREDKRLVADLNIAEFAESQTQSSTDELHAIINSFTSIERQFSSTFKQLEKKASEISILKELSELCYVTFDPEGRRIDVAYAEGPMKHLKNHWLFLDHPDGCEIDFYVDFEFRSKILRTIMGALFHEAVKRMVSAFEARAADLYGPPPQAGISTPAESSE